MLFRSLVLGQGVAVLVNGFAAHGSVGVVEGGRTWKDRIGAGFAKDQKSGTGTDQQGAFLYRTKASFWNGDLLRTVVYSTGKYRRGKKGTGTESGENWKCSQKE